MAFFKFGYLHLKKMLYNVFNLQFFKLKSILTNFYINVIIMHIY